MSLLDAFYKEYTIMNRSVIDDPEGGWIPVTGWTPGATVEMALDDPSQTQRTIAQAAKVQIVNSALFPLGAPVFLGAYLRSNDGKSRGNDGESAVYLVQTKPVEAPGPSGIKVLKAEVIETRLPT